MNIETKINKFLGMRKKDNKKQNNKILLSGDKSLKTERIDKEFIIEDGRKLLID